MSFSKRKRNQNEVDIWPGFVDALSTVLLVFIFVLVGFIASQMYLSGIIFDKDSSISDMCHLLDIEKSKNSNLNAENTNLSAQITDLNTTVETLRNMFAEENAEKMKGQEEKISLEEKINNLTIQLKNLTASLTIEQKSSEQQKEDIEHMKKENLRLSDLTKLSSYKSEFFDKLQEIVKDKEGIRIAGDRFVFQSELFFSSASDELNEEGKTRLSELANVVNDIGKKIPKNIKWILRVDGHTDKRPIKSDKFVSNWGLSAARAISVIDFLILKGVPPFRLFIAGFGEYQPIFSGTTEEDFAKNRRIEFKLDER
jgi:chemotaxis protein MotB